MAKLLVDCSPLPGIRLLPTQPRLMKKMSDRVGPEAWPCRVGGMGGWELGFSQLPSALWATFLLVLGQKGLVNCSESILSLGVLRGPESLH